MKGKLYKENDGYSLFVDGKIFGDTDGHPLKAITNKLSFKNCQAIELGYDLDELAENFWKEEFMKPGLIDTNSYKEGFQKALELMGDKKFSEEDIEKAIEFGHKTYHSWKDRNEEKFIQSLQQTEWDVEVVMDEEKEFIFDPAMGISQGHYLDKPKLDVNGCLILKRIK